MDIRLLLLPCLIMGAVLSTVGISSADSFFLNYKVIELGFYENYNFIKIVFIFIFTSILFHISEDSFKALALITSPLIIAIIYRHGFDFFSLLPCLAMINKRGNLVLGIILAVSIILYFWVKEISILFSILSVIIFIGLKQKVWVISIISALLLASAYFFLPLEFLLESQASVLEKITSTEITHNKNSDFSIFKAYVVYFLSHSYFVFSDSVSVIFAALTCLPIVFLTWFKFLKRAPKSEIFLSFFMYTFTTIFFKTFQHLRIYPFLYFNYFNYLTKKDCSILIWINLGALILHQICFSLVNLDESPIFFVF